MIPRRIAEHMKQQHWTGVFIELVIVILGVFIGLQVDNWNTARNDRALEMQYLQRLHDDIKLSIQQANLNILVLHIQYQLEEGMLAHLASCRLEGGERNRFAAGMYLFGHINPPPLVLGTIDELRSTGRMGLIRDTGLRTQLAAEVWHDKQIIRVWKLVMSRINPALFFMEKRFQVKLPPSGISQGEAAFHGMPNGSFKLNFQALCKDPHSAAIVSTVQQATVAVRNVNKRQLKIFQDLLKMIGRDMRG